MKQEAWILKLDTVPYQEALELQKKLVELRSRDAIPDTLILLEHPPVFTVTREATRRNLLASPQSLEEKRTVLDWVIRPQLRGLAGVADVNSLGGFVRSYEVVEVRYV